MKVKVFFTHTAPQAFRRLAEISLVHLPAVLLTSPSSEPLRLRAAGCGRLRTQLHGRPLADRTLLGRLTKGAAKAKEPSAQRSKRRCTLHAGSYENL